ncbi:unnamed protein product [Adineta ricciae]|uniref:DED domain-containing protein n=1 Tax=Adineta ricciae TaxID=249248 RepID=A0A815STM9_ADIRI|nr:unnamed protein product [Adineta ricciae]
MDHQHNTRTELTKILDNLSNDNRQRLYFLLSTDVPKYLCKDLTLTGTFQIVDYLFDNALITDRNYSYLIEALKRADCQSTANKLLAYEQAQQKTDKKDFMSLSGTSFNVKTCCL